MDISAPAEPAGPARRTQVTSPKQWSMIFKGYRLLLPIVTASAIVSYVFREAIMLVLFSKAFLPMKKMFAFQLIGDFFKIASWLLGPVMIAKAMTFASSGPRSPSALASCCFRYTSSMSSASSGSPTLSAPTTCCMQ